MEKVVQPPKERPRVNSQGVVGARVGKEEERPGSLVKREIVGEVSSEPLRSIDLPPLPQSANSLNFGDWLVIVEPMMADISYSSGLWWELVIGGVQRSYETWGRLRVQVEIDPKTYLWRRTEK